MKNLDLSTLPAKKRKQIVSCLRAGIQLLYFLFLPSVFTAAFNGVKYIFTQIGQGEKIEMTAFVSALLLVCAFTIVFGRFFCGFACAFGRQCPSAVELPSNGSVEISGDCFQCQKCIDTCPKGNIRCGVKELYGNEILFTLFRAVFLLTLLLWAGI